MRTTPLVVAAGLLASLLAGPAAAQQAPPPTPVRVDPVRVEKVREQRRVTGNVRAHARSKVASRESGRVVDVPVRQGDRVEKGAVVATLDADRLKLDLVAMEAERAAAETVVAERRDERERADRDLEILRGLAGRDAANPRELRDAESAAKVAASRVRNAESLVTVLDARLAVLRDRLADMTVAAPFAGVVLARYVEAGEWLSEGAAVVEIASDETEVWLDVPQRDHAHLSTAGGPVRIVSDATGASVEVPTVRVLRDVDPRTRTFAAVARLPAQFALAPGMSVTAWVPTADEGEHLTVHSDAVLLGETGAYVYVALPGAAGQPATAVNVPVDVLFFHAGRAVVRSPRLEAGAQAVVEGNERLWPTAPVLPTPQDATR